MAWIECLVLAAVALFFLFKRWTRKFKLFEERGLLDYEKLWPMLGNLGLVILNKTSMVKQAIENYRRTKSHKVYGSYQFFTPVFVINDPECIKKITVKDFEFFPNHKPFIKIDKEPLFASMLMVMKDQRWKDMRNTLTPIFTASKMRAMFPLMNECFDESLKHLRAQAEGCSGGCEIELKQCFTRLSNDIIATTAFGLKINSYEDKKNIFYQIGQKITNFRGAMLFKFLLLALMPDVMQLLGMSLFDKATCDYFTSMIIDTMKYREENNVVRPDMIQLLMEVKKESAQKWSDVELVAQCFIFFFAAFENNANVICTTCHELMDNPDVQQRLYEEVSEMSDELNGKPLNYDAVSKMKYLDMVVSESLRKWALAPFMDRVCAKDYTLTDEEEKVIFEFKAGDVLAIPVIAIHWDEEYFEHPEIFDPERFSEANKDKIKPFTYMPFGLGQRSCIANRYALMQAKAMLYYLVLNFKLERSPKTSKNLLESLNAFQIVPRDGFWMRLVPRA